MLKIIISKISLPYHLIIPTLISTIVLILIFLNRRRLFSDKVLKLFWICTTLFFGIYLLIVGGSAYSDISAKLTLQKFDLNSDGFFSGAEITTEQRKAMRRVISDTGRNFAVITGLIFSGILTLFFYLISKTVIYIKNRFPPSQKA